MLYYPAFWFSFYGRRVVYLLCLPCESPGSHGLSQVLESVWNSPFEVFIDVTAQTSANELPIEWVANLLRSLPRAKIENCSLIYHYNINTPYRRHLRTIFRNAKHLGFDMEGRSRFLRGLDDVQRFLDLADVHLSENTGNQPLIFLTHSCAGLAIRTRLSACMADSSQRPTCFCLNQGWSGVCSSHICKIMFLRLANSTGGRAASDLDKPYTSMRCDLCCWHRWN